MPGNICSVAICTNSFKKAKQSGENIRIFNFPNDPCLQKEWIRKCYRKDTFNHKNGRICSKHFKPEDYEDAMQARLMGFHPKKLKNDAIPLLYLHTSNLGDRNKRKVSSRIERVEVRERKAIVESLIIEKSNEFTGEHGTIPTVKTIERDTNVINIDSDYDILKRQLQTIQEENENLKKRILIHENNEEIFKKKVSEIETELKTARHAFEQKVRLAFQDCLTADQVDMFLKKRPSHDGHRKSYLELLL